MTVTTEVNSKRHNGNNLATQFTYEFRIFVDTDLKVTHVSAQGVEQVLVRDTDYTVNGAGDMRGGFIDFPREGSRYGVLAQGESLILERDLALTQATDLRNQGGFFSEVIEAALDRVTMLVQQVKELSGRSIKVPVSVDLEHYDLPAPRAGMALGWDQSAQSLINLAGLGGLTVSGFGEALIQVNNAEQAASLLRLTNRGNTRPVHLAAGGLWVDADHAKNREALYCYDGSRDILLGLFDTRANHFTPAVAGLAATAISWTKHQYYPESVLTDGANIDWPVNNEPNAKVSPTATRAMNNATGGQVGGLYLLEINWGAHGDLTWGNMYDFSLIEGAPDKLRNGTSYLLFKWKTDGKLHAMSHNQG